MSARARLRAAAYEARLWALAALLFWAGCYAGLKTGRGQAWDERHAARQEARRVAALSEALALCESGVPRDSRGFYGPPIR
ncbi:MAG TPA: hypothetical protein VNL18_15555 [Gemmatimonadales bacterium]|nr:hypothetical protein [Gemmatimonadales bacterium]